MPSNSASDFRPCGSSGGQLQSLVFAPPDAPKILKTLLATPLAPLALSLLALLALPAGTPGQKGSMQTNSSSALRFLNRSFNSSIAHYDHFACRRLQQLQPSNELSIHILINILALPTIFFGINHLMTGRALKQNQFEKY